MFQPRSIQSSMTLRDKIMSMDYVLLLSILLLGIISMFAMYSTDGGKFDYHTKSHILRFSVFFLLFNYDNYEDTNYYKASYESFISQINIKNLIRNLLIIFNNK